MTNLERIATPGLNPHFTLFCRLLFHSIIVLPFYRLLTTDY